MVESIRYMLNKYLFSSHIVGVYLSLMWIHDTWRLYIKKLTPANMGTYWIRDLICQAHLPEIYIREEELASRTPLVSCHVCRQARFWLRYMIRILGKLLFPTPGIRPFWVGFPFSKLPLISWGDFGWGCYKLSRELGVNPTNNTMRILAIWNIYPCLYLLFFNIYIFNETVRLDFS